LYVYQRVIAIPFHSPTSHGSFLQNLRVRSSDGPETGTGNVGKKHFWTTYHHLLEKNHLEMLEKTRGGNQMRPMFDWQYRPTLATLILDDTGAAQDGSYGDECGLQSAYLLLRPIKVVCSDPEHDRQFFPPESESNRSGWITGGYSFGG
jgi:hypothetical protein